MRMRRLPHTSGRYGVDTSNTVYDFMSARPLDINEDDAVRVWLDDGVYSRWLNRDYVSAIRRMVPGTWPVAEMYNRYTLVNGMFTSEVPIECVPWFNECQPQGQREHYFIPNFTRYVISKGGRVVDTTEGNVLFVTKGDWIVQEPMFDDWGNYHQNVELAYLMALTFDTLTEDLTHNSIETAKPLWQSKFSRVGDKHYSASKLKTVSAKVTDDKSKTRDVFKDIPSMFKDILGISKEEIVAEISKAASERLLHEADNKEPTLYEKYLALEAKTMDKWNWNPDKPTPQAGYIAGHEAYSDGNTIYLFSECNPGAVICQCPHIPFLCTTYDEGHYHGKYEFVTDLYEFMEEIPDLQNRVEDVMFLLGSPVDEDGREIDAVLSLNEYRRLRITTGVLATDDMIAPPYEKVFPIADKTQEECEALDVVIDDGIYAIHDPNDNADGINLFSSDTVYMTVYGKDRTEQYRRTYNSVLDVLQKYPGLRDNMNGLCYALMGPMGGGPTEMCVFEIENIGTAFFSYQPWK